MWKNCCCSSLLRLRISSTLFYFLGIELFLSIWPFKVVSFPFFAHFSPMLYDFDRSAFAAFMVLLVIKFFFQANRRPRSTSEMKMLWLGVYVKLFSSHYMNYIFIGIERTCSCSFCEYQCIVTWSEKSSKYFQIVSGSLPKTLPSYRKEV